MDHYTTLGVSKTATFDEIKKAYRKLASKHHPDRGGDTATFQQIQVAYDTLSDPIKRQEYDNPPRQQFMHGPGGFNQAQANELNEMFSKFFGQNTQFREMFENRQQFKQTYRTQIQISLEDSYRGVQHNLKIQMPSGIKVLNIDIPKGIDNGAKLRYDNVIENGILIIEFLIMPNLKFERRGHDLYVNHSISVLDLIAGSSFNFDTISGKTLEIVVKPKTQPYMQLKIPGHGMPVNNTGHYGDQIILLKPYIPDSIDDRIIDSIKMFNINK